MFMCMYYFSDPLHHYLIFLLFSQVITQTFQIRKQNVVTPGHEYVHGHQKKDVDLYNKIFIIMKITF